MFACNTTKRERERERMECTFCEERIIFFAMLLRSALYDYFMFDDFLFSATERHRESYKFRAKHLPRYYMQPN